MADLTITPSAVAYSGDQNSGIAGEAIDAGEIIYKKTSDGKWYLADANVDAATAAATAMALSTAEAADQYMHWVYLKNNAVVTVGGTVGVGTTYYLSNTPGKLRDDVPISTEYVTICAIGQTATSLTLGIIQGPAKA